MLAHKAWDEGSAAAEIISGEETRINYSAIPTVAFTAPEVSFVGDREEDLVRKRIEYVKGVFPFTANSRAKISHETDGFVKVLASKQDGRVLGVHIVSSMGSELIAEGVAAIEFGMTAEDVVRTCHPHPTMSEAFKEACLLACGKAVHC